MRNKKLLGRQSALRKQNVELSKDVLQRIFHDMKEEWLIMPLKASKQNCADY